MITVDCEQGTPQWHDARRGIPTASCFNKIFTSQGKPATSASTYMDELLAAWFMGETENYTNEWMQRGTELEPEARGWYEFVHGPVDQVGLVYLDDRKLISCSPDGLQESGGLEIKCPKASTHVNYMLSGKCPAQYVPQVQGNIWICEREWWDFLSYHPDSPNQFLIRVMRDDKYIKALSEAVESFVDKMLTKREKLQNIQEAA